MELLGKQVLVVGAGASGMAAAALAKRDGANVILNDRRTGSELGAVGEKADALGVATLFGHHDVVGHHGIAALSEVDLCVLSPGVPSLPLIDALDAAGVEVIGEVELAARYFRGGLVCITGTNGKSTVTTMLGEMVKASGQPTFVGGNLGEPLCRAVGTDASGADGWVVAEVSSFQLERVDTLHPKVAALLNLSPDHLDRYPSFEAYGWAKAQVFARQVKGDAAVIAAGDARLVELAQTGRGDLHRFGDPDGAVRRVDGQLVDMETGFSLPTDVLRLAGRHNVDNACAAMLMARLMGIPGEAIEAGLRAVQGLPHRAQVVSEVAGVRCINDSKATNVSAALASLNGFCSPERRALWIAGGVDKGASYAPLAAKMREVGRAAFLLGEAAPLLESALREAGVPCVRCESMELAVHEALSGAAPGDVLLMAPACSSYDMYRSYAERGEAFAEAVRAFARDGGG